MYSPGNVCSDGFSSRPDPMLSNPDESGTSVSSCEDGEDKKMQSKNAYYSRCQAGSSFSCCSQLELTASPASSTCCHHDWNSSSDHQAKRARVESIVTCMTGSPSRPSSDVMMSQHKESGGLGKNTNIEELPSHQEKRGFGRSPMTRKQPEGRHLRLRQLRTRFSHVDRVTEATDSSSKEKYPNWNNAAETSGGTCAASYAPQSSGLKTGRPMNFQSKPERIKLMADVLKYELSRVVTKSVDSVFKSMQENTETDASLQASVCRDDKVKPSCGDAEGQVPEVLSLVVQKPRLERSDKVNLQSRSKGHHPAEPPTASGYDPTAVERKKQNAPHHRDLRRLQDGRSDVAEATFEAFETRWNSVKVRSKVGSRSVRCPQVRTAPGDPRLLQNLRLPQVKAESDNLVKNNLHVLNEGLTTKHLKKAKLMFFYTRYPGSQVLRRCFHDVQFSRCITSQLIKWFSNFREFYYIQMEKFARHALLQGLTDGRGPTVGRESELFRILNMHYNKANDFQVPDRFLEVAEITLREFYVAVSVGKDRDPSWKKAIYRVICKLDSNVPEEFKTPLCG